MNSTCFFTVSSKNHIHRALTVLKSAKKWYPDADFFIGIPERAREFGDTVDGFQIIRLGELPINDLGGFIFQYRQFEMTNATKPFFARLLMEKHSYHKVIYFDSDIYIYRSLAPMVDLLDAHDIVLTPHAVAVTPDGVYHIDDLVILSQGTINGGYFGLNNSPDSRSMLRWWEDKCLTRCLLDPAKGLFGDQKWLDLVPGMFGNVFVNRDPGWNVAFWNLPHRIVEKKGNAYVVNGSPLTFFHFSGLDPRTNVFTAHNSNFTMDSIGPVKGLAEDYIHELKRNGCSRYLDVPFEFSCLPDGTRIPDFARALYRDNREYFKGINPLSEEGFASFVEFANAPLVIDGREIPLLTNLSYKSYCDVPLFRELYPDILGKDSLEFSKWFVTTGREELGFSEAFVKPIEGQIRIAETQRMEEECARNPREAQLTELLTENSVLEEEIRILRGENDALRNDLETITNTRSYRLARRLSLSPLGYMAAVLLKKKGASQPEPAAMPAVVGKSGFSQEEQSFIERIRKSGGPVSVLNPEWRGIRSSAQELFTENFFIDDALTQETAVHYSDLLTESRCNALVIQGFPLSYRHLVEAFHAKSPRIPIIVIWHGSFLQSGEEINWTGFRSIINYCNRGVLYKLGFVKKGMAEVIGKLGIRTGFVMNFVREIPEGPSKTKNDGVFRIGIWNIKPDWRKQPYAMIAAASALDNVELHISGADHRTMELAQLLKVRARITPDAVPHDEIRRRLAEMDVNLYVTLSECAPMLPLESLSVGSPCLMGPSSHYFEDAQYLYDRLVVPYPDKASVIAQYAKRALEERDRIVHEYIPYARLYNEKARECLSRFMEMSQV